MNESLKLQLIIEAVNRADKALGDVSKYLKDGQADTDKLNAKSRDLTGTMSRLAASMVSVGAALATIKAGVSYLAQIETATLGIAAAYMTGGQYIDATSKKALAADDALKAAQGDSKGIILELQYANLQTIATLDELINAYQVTLPVALAKGFNRQQVKDFTVAMVQAAGAIGLPMNQLGEETRSLLTGAIDPRNSRIATVLGLRNEDIAQYKGNANGLFDFLIDKLSAYRIAGMEAQKTWAGLWSNTKDIGLQALGQAMEPLFEAVKYELTEITNKIVTIDETTKSIKWNPEFLEGVKNVNGVVTSIIAEVYRLSMLLDRIGGSLTRLKFVATFGAIRPGGEEIWKQNDEYRTRYMASEKALQDMAMREVGWKPVTADIDKKMREAALAGKRIAEQTLINVGNPDEGTQQLLRYYKELDKAAPVWQPKPHKPEEDKKLTALKEKWKETLRDMKADEEKAAEEDPFGDKLIEIDKKAAAFIDKFKNIAGSKIEIEKWRTAEENRIITEADKDRREKNDKNADNYQKQVEATEKSIQKGAKETTEVVKKAYEERRAASEAEIQARLTEIEIAEKYYDVDKATALKERIAETEDMIAVQKKYLATIDPFEHPGAWRTQTEKIIALEKTQQAQQKEYGKTNLAGALTLSLKQVAVDAADIFSQINGLVTKAFAGMTDALTDFVMTGKLNFSDLANSIIRDMIRIQIQQQVTGPLATAAGGWLGSLFGSSTTAAAAGGSSSAYAGPTGVFSGQYPAFTAMGQHSGGMGNEPTFYRFVPNLDLLPRHHKGIGPNERLTVTTNDESTMTPGQRKDFFKMAQQLGGGQQPTENHYATTVQLTINALDSRSVSQALAQHRAQIVGLVNLAYNKRGQRGPLGS